MKPDLGLTAAPGWASGAPVAPRRTRTHPTSACLQSHQLDSPPSHTRPQKEPKHMPLPHRGRGSRLAGSRVASTSLPRDTAHSPRRSGRGAPLPSHAQRLTRRRHFSEQVPPGPEPQADFRSGKWRQERAGGDARDSRRSARAGMGSRHRSVPAVPLGRASPSSWGLNSSPHAQRAPRSFCIGPPPPRNLAHLEPAASQRS